MIREKILELLQNFGEMNIRDLEKELNEHPGIIRKVIEELVREGKIKLIRKRNSHSSVKYILLLSIA